MNTAKRSKEVAQSRPDTFNAISMNLANAIRIIIADGAGLSGLSADRLSHPSFETSHLSQLRHRGEHLQVVSPLLTLEVYAG